MAVKRSGHGPWQRAASNRPLASTFSASTAIACGRPGYLCLSIDEYDFYASIVQVFLFWCFLLVVPPLIPR
jgi:hypothetical protein